MARPQKNNADYFSHDNNMRNNKCILAIRRKYGIAGYALWGMILESLCASDGFSLKITDIEIELMAGDFGVEPEILSEFLEYCCKLNMLIKSPENIFYSESMINRFNDLLNKRERQRNWKKAVDNHEQSELSTSKTPNSGIDVVENPQSKVKESKVNKTKVVLVTVKERKQIFAATLEPFLETYGRDMLNDFYAYWTEDTLDGLKFKLELQETWSLERRLKNWHEREKKVSPGAEKSEKPIAGRQTEQTIKNNLQKFYGNGG